MDIFYIMKLILVNSLLGCIATNTTKFLGTTEQESVSESERWNAVTTFLEGGHTRSIEHVLDKAVEKFHDFNKLNLPSEVQLLLGKGDDDVTLDSKAIDKARTILNQMMESAQEELDAKMMACKEFRERNRASWEQVRTDLLRLSGKISDLEGDKQSSTAEITTSTEMVNGIEEEREHEVPVILHIHHADEEEMRWRRNDLKVAEFLLKLTKCKNTSMLLQFKAPVQIRRCLHEKDGQRRHSAAFASKQLRLAMMSTSKEGKNAIHRVLLASSQAPPKKTRDRPRKQPPKGAGKNAPASARKQAKKCTLGKPNCGLLHDNMSLMWGEMKDAVDKLEAKMRRESKAWEKKKDNYNAQISLNTSGKEQAQSHLSEAIAEQTADSAEQDKKQQEERRLELEFRRGWRTCVREINEILFTKFCGVKAARGELHKKSKDVKPDDIIDCQVTDWVAQPCSVSCDDNKVGGLQMMVREMLQMKNQYGIGCPKLKMVKKCSQFPCPVNCEQSNWSNWSSCTADCGGGIQSRSRTVLTRPHNGGTFCDVPSELEECNTGSCDRNCKLSRWKMRPCSVACGGGWIIRKKHVIVRARGKGTCPNRRSWRRYGKKRCNTRACYGDEECIAKQDVVVAVDGSGSVKKKGFRVLRDFAASLVEQFRGEVQGWVEDDNGDEKLAMVTASRIGVVQFGQGVLLRDNTVGKAEDFGGGMSNDSKKVATKIRGTMKFRKGFTNMAQAFTAAENIFLNGGRPSAQSVVICISDGKPSFNFQTANAVKRARRQGVKIIMVVVKQFLKTDQRNLMRSWASVPRRTTFIHIPGLKDLRHRMKHWVNHTLIRSCSKTISSAQENEEEEAWQEAKRLEELAEYGDVDEKASAFLQS